MKKDGEKKAKEEPLSNTMAQLKVILKLILGSKELAYGSGILAILILKTFNDVWIMTNGTQIEAAIITANISSLRNTLGSFLLAMPTLAVTNNLFKYFLNKLRIDLRTRLSTLIYHKYIEGLTFYRINAYETRIKNIDQLMTADVEKFCNTLVDVYSNISKPLLDIITLVYRLSLEYTGPRPPLIMISYLIFSGIILTNLRRPLTRLTVKETQLEGQLRHVHSRLITNCEEIAFYQGNNRERLTLMSALNRLKLHLNNVAIFKFNLDFVDNLLGKCK